MSAAAVALAAHPRTCPCQGTEWVCEDHPTRPFIGADSCTCVAVGRPCPGPVVQRRLLHEAAASRLRAALAVLEDQTDHVRAGFSSADELRELGLRGDVLAVHERTEGMDHAFLRQVIATLVATHPGGSPADAVLLAVSRLGKDALHLVHGSYV